MARPTPPLANLLSAALLAACAARPHPPARAPERPAVGLPASGAIDLVRSLSNTVGPRLAGSAGDPLAVAWGVSTLRALGFANVHTEPVRAPHWERGEEHAEIVSPVHQQLAVAALGGSPGTPEGGLRARVVEFNDLADLQAAPSAEVEGRIVFFNHVMRRTRDGAGYGEAVGIRGRGPIEASRRGAVAVVIRSVGTDSTRMPHTGATREEPGVRAIPSAALSVADADTLHDLVARGGDVELHLSLGARTLPLADTANVVGEVVGRERPGEVILLGAHLDSWDLGRGALDDGAGVSIVVSCARSFVEHPLPRTVRVVLFANEENGVAGARAYAEAHRDEAARHVVALEADAGDGAVFALRWGGGAAYRARVEGVAQTLADLGVRFDPGEAHGGADLSPLRQLGVPVMDLQQDMSAYFDHHHTANDTPSVVRASELDQAVEAFRRVVRAVATMSEDLGHEAPRADAHR